MPEQSHVFGGGATTSHLTPFFLVAMIFWGVLILAVPRRYVVLPYLFGTFLTPLGQQLYVAGVHLFVIRILIIVGLARAWFSRGSRNSGRFVGGWTGIDRAFLYSVLIQMVAVCLLYRDSAAVVNQFGFLLDFLGAYLLVRILVRDEEQMYAALKCLAVVAVILAAGMTLEHVKLTNVFGLLGSGRVVPEIRDGKIRSQGVFQHSILAGSFGSTLIPLFVLLWTNGKSKLFALAGIFGATVMMYTSQSSTPVLSYAAGVLGLAMWPLRKRMKPLRWAMVAVILGLAAVMKAPVWFLIARIDLTGSSSGYHRAELVDNFIRHFWDWWLIGSSGAGTWGYDLWDVQNQYVAVGETGGLLALCFFIALVARSFGRLGDARKVIEGDKSREWLLWALGSCLFAHAVGFIGVNYFDQMKVSWFLILAMICAATAPILANAPMAVPETVKSSRAALLDQWRPRRLRTGTRS